MRFVDVHGESVISAPIETGVDLNEVESGMVTQTLLLNTAAYAAAIEKRLL